MNHTDCIFCKIIAKEIPSKIIAENDRVLVIQDIAPKAPVHYLIIPKKHLKDISSVATADHQLFVDLLSMAQQLAAQLPGSQAFRLLVNNGADAGQRVFHLHIHFISGKTLPDF